MIGIIVGILDILAFLFFIFIIFKVKKKWAGIKHYEKIRDKVTIREEEKEEQEYSEEEGSGGGFLGNLIGGAIIIVVGINILPVVMDQVALANNAIITGAAGTLLEFIPLFFALGIMSAGVALTVGGLRNAGLIGEDEEEPIKKEFKKEPEGIKHYKRTRDKMSKK